MSRGRRGRRGRRGSRALGSRIWENGCGILSSATNIKSHYQPLCQCRFTCDGYSYCRHYLLLFLQI